MTTTFVGVLDSTRLYWHDGHMWVWVLAPASSAGQLCDLAIAHHLHAIWVTPGSGLSQIARREPECLEEENNGDYDYRITRHEGIPTGISVERRHGTWEEKRRIYIGLPEHNPQWMTDDESWALADIEHPAELVMTIASVEHALSPRRVYRGRKLEEPFHMAYSPGWCGLDLLKKYVKLYGHAEWMRAADLSMLPTAPDPGGFKWKRALTSQELRYKYIHFYDRNAQFPAAATGAELGEGTPEHVGPGQVDAALDGKKPGIWYVTVGNPSEIGNWFPSIAPAGSATWLWTPAVNALAALGYTYTVYEGYYWPQHHRTLNEWAHGLWASRLLLREKYGKNSAQEHMAKMIANRGLGWLDLGSVRERGRNPSQDLENRPDWYNMIRAMARFRLVLKLREMEAKHGLYPAMIVADNIAYISDDPDPERAAPGLMIRSKELGGFKHDGTYQLADVFPHWNLAPDDIRKQVKKLEKVSVGV